MGADFPQQLEGHLSINLGFVTRWITIPATKVTLFGNVKIRHQGTKTPPLGPQAKNVTQVVR